MIAKRKSDLLKGDVISLTNNAEQTHFKVLKSGPVTPCSAGDEVLSRISYLSKWIKQACSARSTDFNKFNIFWGKKDTSFKRDGFYLNRSGAKRLVSNIFYSLKKVHHVNRNQIKSPPDDKRHSAEASE